MAALWKIYREHEILGPMTAADVRQALREGIVDPFDMVGKEDSNLRIELLEADEVFEVEGAPGLATEESTQVNLRAQASAPLAQPPAGIYERIKAKYRTNMPQPVGDGTASGRVKQAPRPKLSPKLFYLIDRQQRTLGPLSASEILSLFYRGILDRSVRVQKEGSYKRLPINKFISAYAGQRINDLSGGAVAAANRRRSGGKGGDVILAQPSSKVLNELSRGIAARNLAATESYLPLISLLGMGLLVGVLAFVLMQTKPVRRLLGMENAERTPRRSAASSEEEVLLKKPGVAPRRSPRNANRRPEPAMTERLKSPKLTRPNRLRREAAGDLPIPAAIRQRSQGSARLAPSRQGGNPHLTKELAGPLDLENAASETGVKGAVKRSLAPTAKNRHRTNPRFRRRAPKPLQAKPMPKIRSLPAAITSEPSDDTPRKATVPVTWTPVAAAAKPMAPHGDDRPRAASPSRRPGSAVGKPERDDPPVRTVAKKADDGGGLDGLDAKVGQIATLGPLHFSPKVLNGCDIKCKVVFKDGKGTAITGIFFKDAYVDALKGSGGRTTLTGTVKKDGGGFSIIISGVK